MRVVHLVSGDLWAGAEAATFALVRALARRNDVQVSALVLNPGELATRLAAAGVAVVIEPESGRSFSSLVRAVRARTRDADRVHAHRYKENLLAALSGRPWIATQHGRPEPFAGAAALRMRAYLALDRLARRRAQALIAVSSEVAEWLAPRSGPTPIFVAANGIDAPPAAAGAAAWADRPRRVGVVARLVPVKDVGLAIDAVAATRDIALEIVGDGPEREALEARALASGAAARIQFVGFDPSPAERMAGWRALLVTSRHEGHPIGVLEALAVGTPVISAPLRGVAEMLDVSGVDAPGVDAAGLDRSGINRTDGSGINRTAGWVLTGRDPRAWGRMLERIVADDAAGAAASRAARLRFEAAFTADAAAERVIAIYRNALSRNPPPPHNAR